MVFSTLQGGCQLHLLAEAPAGDKGLIGLCAGPSTRCGAGTLCPAQQSMRRALCAAARPQPCAPLHAQLQQIGATPVRVQVRMHLLREAD